MFWILSITKYRVGIAKVWDLSLLYKLLPSLKSRSTVTKITTEMTHEDFDVS
jgi:hypothetical protein